MRVGVCEKHHPPKTPKRKKERKKTPGRGLWGVYWGLRKTNALKCHLEFFELLILLRYHLS